MTYFYAYFQFSYSQIVILLVDKTFLFFRKYLNESYEQHILQVGDFDERIFIKDDSESQIGTPTKRVTAFTDVDERERYLEIQFFYFHARNGIQYYYYYYYRIQFIGHFKASSNRSYYNLINC